MRKVKTFILNYLYLIIFSLFSLVGIIFFFILKIKLDGIVLLSPNIYIEINGVINLIGIFISLMIAIGVIFIVLTRFTVSNFAEDVCNTIDKIMSNEEEIKLYEYKDNLLSKVQNKFKRLFDIMENNRKEALVEKENIQSLIANISHQIKTPIANISMYNETLIARDLNKDQQKMFLGNMQFQVSKLQWLVESLIKMSRLESNIIKLNKKESLISDTIANALSNVYLKAEEKEIELIVECPDNLKLNHDKKWTSEALFNVIDNAVKYTKPNGKIEVNIKSFEIFTKIDVSDNGIGISEEEINKIFKRFYRAREVSDVEGVGIGLYLSNEIITKQGGYMKVVSKKNEGSTFSIFLKN